MCTVFMNGKVIELIHGEKINKQLDLLSRQISDMDKCVVERSEDVGNSKNILTFTGLKLNQTLTSTRRLLNFLPTNLQRNYT